MIIIIKPSEKVVLTTILYVLKVMIIIQCMIHISLNQNYRILIYYEYLPGNVVAIKILLLIFKDFIRNMTKSTFEKNQYYVMTSIF